MSRFEEDNKEISRIQFHTDFDRKTKNRLIQEIEDRQSQEEQKEIDGRGTGYYN